MKLGTDTLEALLHAAPDALVVVDEDGRIVYVNDRTVQLFGWRSDELVGQAVELLVPTRFAAAHPSLREQYAARPTARPMGTGLTLTAAKRDGTEFPIEISLSPITSPVGVLYAAAIRDVSVARRTEQRFRALLDLAPDAIVGVDREGSIVLANVQAERVFGWDPGELVGQKIEALVPAGVADRHADLRVGYMADPVTRPMGAGLRLAARRRDGTVFTTEISLSAIEDQVGELIVLAAVRDVTERVELEAERQRQALAAERIQSQHLESLGQLSGGIAHDFNNLLGVILSYATLAARQDDREAVRADLAVIRQAAERAASLTKQLLAFGRRDLVRFEELDLNDVVREFAGLLERTLGEHIEISVSTSTLPLTVLADRNHLEQALLNLALNARDAMPRGGLLTIACERHDVDDVDAARHESLHEGQYARIRVADTGTGMTPEVVRRAFEPFFTTKPRGSGTGLGLASTYGIVTQNNGTVLIDSEPGRGTTMSVLLPLADSVQLDQTDDGAHGSVPTARILVVEDEEALRSVTARMLREHGFDVVVAGNGREALDLLATDRRQVDVVLTDVVMPKMSGSDLARALHRDYPGLPVVYMTGYAEPDFAVADGEVVIAKPFTEVALLEAVASALPDDRPWPRGGPG